MIDARAGSQAHDPWLRRWSKPAIGLACLLAAVSVPLYAVKVDRKHDYTDFSVYYKAAERIKLGQWDQVYNLNDGASPFRYAPPLLPFFRPFAELTLPQARMGWYFLQCAWFALGFALIARALGLTRSGRGRRSKGVMGRSELITAIAFLFVLRFCLDCFTIGQVSSLLFLGYAAALYAWMARKPGLAGSALLIPSVFKIGPGFLFSLLAIAPKRSERERSLAWPLAWTLLATGFLAAWVGGWERFRELWRSWLVIVANDSVYYDASHYGSQSIKSAILRAAKAGWLTDSQAHALYLGSALVGCAAILGFWLTRRARAPIGRGAFFALGIFPYLWFMPETFKYSLTTLAIPVALLLAEGAPGKRLPRLSFVALVFGALTLSAAGLDIVGKRAFFAMQQASLPLAATLLLGLATWRMARRHSRPAWQASVSAPEPWPTLPRARPELSASLLVPLPMQSTGTLHASDLSSLIAHHHEALSRATRGESAEILLIPFGNRASSLHPTWHAAERIARELPGVRLLPCSAVAERASALRDGFLASSGRAILALNAEQPAEPAFYAAALEEIRSSRADVVRGNRRHPDSRFRIPVRTLRLVYGRHRLGLLFNRFVRSCLPIRTTDTHSGSWAMTREAATAIFALQRSPGFLSDLEAWITASTYGFRQLDLPVSLYLPQEKSATRVGRETWAILRGIPSLALRSRSGRYAPLAAQPQAITADDWGITPGVNQGILELARLGIVRRVSAMAYGGHLRAGLGELQSVPGVSVGIHFDLTLGKSTPWQVLLDWLKPGADRSRLGAQARDELQKQLAILNDAGIRPTHLDGHHHIHLVPGMLDALAPAIRAAGIHEVRLPEDPALRWSKPLLWLLARAARSAFKRQGFEVRPCFYPNAGHFADQGKLRAALKRHPHAEVIVHPSAQDDLPLHQVPDPYSSGRVTEYRALRMLALDWAPSTPSASRPWPASSSEGPGA
jgi:predicted glycoside hydrolase/deacetylase ChbG (UPF0249 family)